MNAPNEIDAKIGERATEQMSLRMRPRVKSAIQRAAALLGVDASAFAIDALYNAALATISKQGQTAVSANDYAAILDALDAPPEPTETMRNTVEGYKQRVTSR
jgi:uncharacterized protein (DUF1778 family)